MGRKIKYPYEFNKKIRKIAKGYTKIRVMNGVVNGIIIPIVFVYALLVSGLSVSMRFFDSVPVYAFLFLSFMALVQFPLRFYSGYILEHRYGLSNQSLKSWIKDYSKGLFLTFLFSVPVISGLYYLLPLPYWWLYAGVAYFFLTVFISHIFPILIFPFFYKIEPYKDRRMKKRLVKMAQCFGKRIENVFVAKESEKSKKANAMFSGLGRTKRIVLFDTLLNSFTKDEIETVIGHELGHYVNKDTIRYIIIDAARIFPVLLIIDYILRSNVGRFGISAINDIASLPLFMLAYFFIELAFSPALNAYSRHREKEADLFGLNVCKKPDAQISTEKRLADMDLIDDNPHPLVEFFVFTHPPPAKRIRMIKSWKLR